MLKTAKDLGAHPPADINKQGRRKGLITVEGLEANKILKIRVLTDLLNGFFIAQAKFVFDNHSPDHKTPILRGTTHPP